MAIFFGDLEDSGNMITLLDDFLPILRATDILFKVKLQFSLVQCPGERFVGMIFHFVESVLLHLFLSLLPAPYCLGNSVII